MTKDLYFSPTLQSVINKRNENLIHPYVIVNGTKKFFTEQIKCGRKPLTSSYADNVFIGKFFISEIKYN